MADLQPTPDPARIHTAQPCHALGGAFHRCDGPPRWRLVSFNGHKAGRYHWCSRAVEECLRDAVEFGEEVQVLDEHSGPPCERILRSELERHMATDRLDLVDHMRELIANGQLDTRARLEAVARSPRLLEELADRDLDGGHWA